MNKSTEILRARNSDPVFTEKVAKGLRDYYAVPENREKIRAAIRKRWDDPEQHKAASEFHKKRLADPEERQKISDGRKRAIAEHPETREHYKRAVKKRFEDLEYKTRHIESLKERAQTVEFRRKQRAGILRYWSAPGYKETRSGANNYNWKGGPKDYCEKFNNELKERVRNSFNRKCVMCGTLEKKAKHCCHHITFDRKSGCFGKRWNLLPLCKKDHAWTTMHRWESFNLLMNWWAILPDINFNKFAFCELTLDAQYLGLKF